MLLICFSRLPRRHLPARVGMKAIEPITLREILPSNRVRRMSREFTRFLAIIIMDVLLGVLCLAIAHERGSPALRFSGRGLRLCTLRFLQSGVRD